MTMAPERMALVAAHSWDTHGAAQAGFVTGWLRRKDKEFPSTMTAPDVEGDSLENVIQNLANL
jgi:2-haloacid dehalogenase